MFKRKNFRSLGCGLLGKLVLGLLASLAIDCAVYGNRKHIPLRASVVGTVTWASLAELGTKGMGLSTPENFAELGSAELLNLVMWSVLACFGLS